MTGEIKKIPRKVYSDIIDMPHHQSTVHPHMSLYDRAAQFAPFAALTGFEDMVDSETASHNASFDPVSHEDFVD